MMSRKEAKKQFKAFRKMARSRYDDMGPGEKLAGFAVAGAMIGLASWLGRSMMMGECSAQPKAGKIPSAS